MATTKQEGPIYEYTRFKSPKVTTGWTTLTNPDTKYKKSGEFHVEMLLNPENAEDAKFLAEIARRHEEAVDAAKEFLAGNPKRLRALKVNEVIKDQLSDETGEPTGLKIVKAKMAHIQTDKKTKQPRKVWPQFFSASTKEMKREQAPRLSGGSVVRVQGDTRGYLTDKTEAGISVFLSAVQIIKAVEWKATRFEAEEGYEAPEFTTITPTSDGFEDEGVDAVAVVDDGSEDF